MTANAHGEARVEEGRAAFAAAQTAALEAFAATRPASHSGSSAEVIQRYSGRIKRTNFENILHTVRIRKLSNSANILKHLAKRNCQ